MSQNIGCLPHEIIDFSSNINPLGPVSGVMEYLIENIEAIYSHPEVDSKKLIETTYSLFKWWNVNKIITDKAR